MLKAAVAIGCVLLLEPLVSTQGGGAPSSATSPGNAGNGKALFITYQCFACHGYNGETGTRFLQEDGRFITRLQTLDRFVTFIRAPRPNEAPPVGSSTNMPSYGVSSLSDQQAADLFAYIKTFKSTTPPLKDIPLLSEMGKAGGNPKK